MDSYNVTIGQDKKQVFINVYHNNVRYRFWNGKAIEIKLRVYRQSSPTQSCI